MNKLLPTIIMLCTASCLQARSMSYAVKRSELAPDSLQNKIVFRQVGNKAPGNTHRVAALQSKKKTELPYDVTLESGSYFFDPVYKLKVPASKFFDVGLNGGYTYYDRYVHGFGTAGSLGLVAGLSVTMLPRHKGVAGQIPKRSAFRLNADLSSYPYRKIWNGESIKGSLVDKYTREISTRVYLDAKLSWRSKKGTLTTRGMIGITAGPEQLTGAVPFFVGAGLGYRFL